MWTLFLVEMVPSTAKQNISSQAPFSAFQRCQTSPPLTRPLSSLPLLLLAASPRNNQEANSIGHSASPTCRAWLADPDSYVAASRGWLSSYRPSPGIFVTIVSDRGPAPYLRHLRCGFLRGKRCSTKSFTRTSREGSIDRTNCSQSHRCMEGD